MYSKCDNIHKKGITYAFKCTNNSIISSINHMLSDSYSSSSSKSPLECEEHPCPLPWAMPLPLPFPWAKSSSFFLILSRAHAKRAFSSLFEDLSFTSWMFNDPRTSSTIKVPMSWNYFIELVMPSNFLETNQSSFSANSLSIIFSQILLFQKWFLKDLWNNPRSWIEFWILFLAIESFPCEVGTHLHSWSSMSHTWVWQFSQHPALAWSHPKFSRTWSTCLADLSFLECSPVRWHPTRWRCILIPHTWLMNLFRIGKVPICVASLSPSRAAVTATSINALSPRHNFVVKQGDQNVTLIPIEEYKNTFHTLTTLKKIKFERIKLLC